MGNTLQLSSRPKIVAKVTYLHLLVLVVVSAAFLSYFTGNWSEKSKNCCARAILSESSSEKLKKLALFPPWYMVESDEKPALFSWTALHDGSKFACVLNWCEAWWDNTTNFKISEARAKLVDVGEEWYFSCLFWNVAVTVNNRDQRWMLRKGKTTQESDIEAHIYRGWVHLMSKNLVRGGLHVTSE